MAGVVTGEESGRSGVVHPTGVIQSVNLPVLLQALLQRHLALLELVVAAKGSQDRTERRQYQFVSPPNPTPQAGHHTLGIALILTILPSLVTGQINVFRQLM